MLNLDEEQKPITSYSEEKWQHLLDNIIYFVAGAIIFGLACYGLGFSAGHKDRQKVSIMDMRDAMKVGTTRAAWQNVYCSPEHEQQLRRLDFQPMDAK